MDISQIRDLAETVKQAKAENFNEAMTKTTLVMPFLRALGYDVFNHKEVAAEYTSDFGTKKGEKVDFAILRRGSPVMLIECKPIGTELDSNKCSQLFRYFTTCSDVKIGILTDGCRYMFFSDLEQENVMDRVPFMEIDIANFHERLLPELDKLSKSAWDMRAILSSAWELKSVQTIKEEFAKDMENPSNEFVKFYGSLCCSGPFTAKLRKEFWPLVKRALDEYFEDRINQRLEAAKFTGLKAHVEKEIEEVNQTLPKEPQNNESGVITYNTEVWALVLIRTVLRDIVAPCRIGMRDQKSYCSILLDNNNRKTICRLYNFTHFDWGMENIGDHAAIHIFNTEKGERFPLTYIDDIYPLVDNLIQAVKRIDNK